MVIVQVADAILLALLQAKPKSAAEVAADAQAILAHNKCADASVSFEFCVQTLVRLEGESKVAVEVPGMKKPGFSRFFPVMNRVYRLTRDGHVAKCRRIRATRLRIPRELDLVKM